MLNFAEKCLEDYPVNLARLDVLTQDYQSNPSDKLETEINSLRSMTQPLQKMIDDLSSNEKIDNILSQDMLTVLGTCYFGRNSINAILEMTGWSRAKLFRRKNNLIKLAADYLADYFQMETAESARSVKEDIEYRELNPN